MFSVGVNPELEQSQTTAQNSATCSTPVAVFGSRLTFRDEEVYFHSDLSEKLLTLLSEKGKLSDLTMTLFETSTMRLR